MKKNISALVLLSFLLTYISIKSFAQAPDSWIQKSDFGGAERFGAVGFSIGTKGYIGTGWTTLRVNDFWEYDPITDTWTQKADFGGTARVLASGFSVASKGYIGTGDDGVQRNDFWEYNPVSNMWTQKADFGGIPRVGAVSFSIGSKGYMGTGEINDASVTKLNDFWEYDPSIDSWSQKSDAGGSGRSFSAGFNLGNKGYIGTGHDATTFVKDFWEYDPSIGIGGTWTKKADFGGASRYGAIGMRIGAYGWIGTGGTSPSLSNDFWEYNPFTDSWTQKNSFAGAGRFLATCFGIRNKGYIGTGQIQPIPPTVNSKDFWVYTPTCNLPEITTEPSNQSLTYGDVAQFTVAAIDVTSYQWQVDAGSGFVDIADGGIYSNATNDTLDISLPNVDMTGYKYRCVLTGNCLPDVITNGNATLTVSPLSITLTPHAGQTKVYGLADPTPFSYTFAPALVGTDVIAGLMDRVAGENVGDYAFTLGTLTAGSNYNLTIAAAPAFSITALHIVINPDAGQTKVYGSADPTPFSFTFAPDLIGTDIISGLMDRTAGEDVGSYIFSTGSLTAGTNYNLTVAAAPTFDITAKALTITAEDKEKCYDGSIYNGTYTVNYSGFVNSEDETELGGILVFGGTSAAGTLAGNYSIVPSGLTTSNYTIGYVNGTLVIKATPDVSVIIRGGDSIVSNVAAGNHWYLDGIEIPGSNGDVHIATINGTYNSIVTENGCSSAPSNSITVLDVSIREVSAEIFDIYPNPSNGLFNIKLKTTGKSLYNIEIYNSLGALVWKQNNAIDNGNNIKIVDLNGPKSGLYTVVLKNKANSFAKKVYIAK